MRSQILIVATPPVAATIRGALAASVDWEVAEIQKPDELPAASVAVVPEVILIEADLYASLGPPFAKKVKAEKFASRMVLLVLAPDGAPTGPFPEAAGVVAAPFDEPPLARRLRQMVDEARVLLQLSRLEKLGGPDFVGEMIDLFLDLMPGRLATLRNDLQKGNLEGVRFAAHQLKSSAGNLGAILIYDLANEIEAITSRGETAGLAELVEAEEAAYERIRLILVGYKRAGS